MSIWNRWWSSAMLPALPRSALAISNQPMLSPYSTRWAVYFMSTKHWPPSCLGKNNTGAFTNIVHTKKNILKIFKFVVQYLQEVQVWSSYATRLLQIRTLPPYVIRESSHSLYNPLLCHFHTQCGMRKILLTEPFNMYLTNLPALDNVLESFFFFFPSYPKV